MKIEEEKKKDKSKRLKKQKVKKVKVKKQKDKKRLTLNIFKVDGKFKFVPLLINILIPLVGGLLVGYLNSGSMGIYSKLEKSIINPPAMVFQIVWPILYILMGIAAYRIYMKNKSGVNDNGAYFYYLIQLVLNLLWPFVFFTFRLYGVSFVLIVILLILVILTAYKFYKVDKLAGYLMIPYIVWLLFASILNFFVYMLNEM